MLADWNINSNVDRSINLKGSNNSFHRCFVCNSMKDPDCFDGKNLNKNYIQNCEPINGTESIGCWKLEQWINFNQNAGKF